MIRKLTIKMSVGCAGGFLLIAFVFSSFFLSVVPARSDAAVIHVAKTGHNQPNCGAVSAPCASVQYAAVLAQDNDTVQVAQGVYSETVVLTKSIQLLGGYDPFNWTREIAAYTTVISGNQAGSVIQIIGGSMPTIEGFHIVDGLASMGGGIYVYDASPTISQNNINSNTTTSSGAGIYISGDSAPVIVGNLITENRITGYYHGAGVYAGSGTAPHILNNIISFNMANRGWGGGIYVINSGAIIAYNDIHHNQVGSPSYQIPDGGGIQVESTTGIIHHNYIHDNSAYDDGGGVFLKSFVTLSDNVIENNRVVSGNGAGIAIWGSQTTGSVNRNKITNNEGEGVYVWGGAKPLFTANVIADNTAGGVYVSSASAQMDYSTIARNNGSGVLISLTSSVVLTNTILTEHTNGIVVDSGSEVIVDGVLWYNNSVNTSGAGTLTVKNAIVGDPFFAVDGYHLTAVSAAIDRGVITNATADIDGLIRPFDGNFDGITLPDLGADEFGYRAYLPVVSQELR